MPGKQEENTSRLDRAEHYIFLAAGLLVASLYEMAGSIMAGKYTSAIIHLLDRVLLALMLAETIYTVGRIARTQQLETQPFLIVGIIAAIRRMLIIRAASAGHANLTEPVFQAQMTEPGLLGLIIFLLAGQ